MLERVGKYEIKGALGRGGSGKVFRALDPTMGRMVAIKVLATGGEPGTVTPFNPEAAAAGRLRHKNIVTVFDFREQDGIPFIVMELLEGEDLQRVIEDRRSLPLFEKVRIVMEVASGLHHAHTNGVVHRNVKPANVMLLHDGGVKITDFGVALLTGSTGPSVTPHGSVVGTVRYQAPEQFSGQEPDALSDIFSLGVIFYELVTGTHPFGAREPAGLMHNIVHLEPPPLRSLSTECPEGLERIVARLLAKNREARYPSLEDVQFELEAVRLELGKTRAAELVAKAREREAQGELEAAQALVREILEMEPAHSQAREMRESLQRQIHRRGLQTQIDALVRSGREELAARHYPAAIENFESAVRLDKGNPELKKLLAEARSRMEEGLASLECLAEARRRVEQKDYPGAREALAGALRHDPQNHAAVALFQTVEDTLAREHRERAVDEAIQSARNFLWMRAYDDAANALIGLGDDARSPKLRHLLDWIGRQKAESERRERLNIEVAAARDLLRVGMLDAALQWLDRLAADFPDEREVAQLRLYAQAEAAGQSQTREVERVSAEAGARLSASDFSGALRVIDQALWNFPQSAALHQLRAGALAAQAESERQRAIQAALHRCGQLGSEQRFAEAIHVANDAARELGPDPLLADALRRLEAWQQQEKAAHIGRAESDALALLGIGDYDGAIQSVAMKLQKWPADETLLALMDRIRAERIANRKSRASGHA